MPNINGVLGDRMVAGENAAASYIICNHPSPRRPVAEF